MTITAEQYLHMSFEHDAEFVEGKIVGRPAPYWEHSRMQGFLIEKLWPARRQLGWITLLELRVQTGPERFRVPDVCVIRERPDEQSLRKYLKFGVEWVWVIDPVALAGQVHSRGSVANVEDRIFSTDRFTVDLSTVEY